MAALPRTKVELLEKLLASTDFYDCTFTVGTGKNVKEYKALKAHLANISEVFRAQLFGKFAEASQNRDTPILLPNVDPEIFECILRESYGLDPKINEDNVLRLIDESKYYSIPLLANDCIMWLKDHLDGSNVLQVLNNAYLSGLVKFKVFNQELADFLKEDDDSKEETTTTAGGDDETKDDSKDDSKDDVKGGGLDDEEESKDPVALTYAEGIDSEVLQFRCLTIICENAKEVVESEYFWKSLHINVIIFMICNDYFNVSEDLLWGALVKWAEYQEEQHRNATNPPTNDTVTTEAKTDDAATTTATEENKQNESRNQTELPAESGGDKGDKPKVTMSDGALGIAPGLDLSADIAVKWCQENGITLENPPPSTGGTNEDANAISGTGNSSGAPEASAFFLLQPLIQYVRFANMSHKYFCENVPRHLLRKDMEYIVGRMLCPEIKEEQDEERGDRWKLSDDERKDLVQLRRDAFEKITPETKEFATNGRKFEVVKASIELEKARNLGVEGTDAEWSRNNLSSQPIQWFIVKINIALTQLRFISNELRINWKNHYSDSDTIRNVQISACVLNNVTDPETLNGTDDDQWQEITTWSGNQTTDVQTFNLDISALRSPFIKFHVVDTFGGYTCLDDLKIFATATE